MMISTVEIRWFFQGDLPAEIHEWFLKSDKEAIQSEPRTDYYLRIGIHKKRYLHFFGTTESGCGWEIAEVRISGRENNWWAMGFEAFGDRLDPREILLNAIKQSGINILNCKFDIVNSQGYTKWLFLNLVH